MIAVAILLRVLARIERLRFEDKDEYEYEIFSILIEPVSFWRENVIAVVILILVLARMS